MDSKKSDGLLERLLDVFDRAPLFLPSAAALFRSACVAPPSVHCAAGTGAPANPEPLAFQATPFRCSGPQFSGGPACIEQQANYLRQPLTAPQNHEARQQLQQAKKQLLHENRLSQTKALFLRAAAVGSGAIGLPVTCQAFHGAVYLQLTAAPNGSASRQEPGLG